MDFCGIGRGTIRSNAYRKLAKLSVENVPSSLAENKADNFQTLIQSTSAKELLAVAISLREFEVLLALCESTTCDMKFPKQAEVLASKFRLYLLELPSQQFSEAVLESLGRSSPWYIVGERLSSALVNLAFKFDDLLLTSVVDTFTQFVEKFFTAQPELSHYLTLLGVLAGLTKNARLFTTSPDAFKVFVMLDNSVDSAEFLNSVEAYCSQSHVDLRQYADLDSQDFSPILFVEALGRLMCAITNSILGNADRPLLDFLLSNAAKDHDESDGLIIGNGVANGNGVSNGNGYHNGFSLEITSVASSEFGPGRLSDSDVEMTRSLADIAAAKMDFLDRGETYIVYSTFARLKLGYLAKSHFLQVIACGISSDVVDFSIGKTIFHNAIGIHDVMLDSNLGATVIQLGALLVFKDPSVGTSLTRVFTSLVANPKMNVGYCQVASKSVGLASKVLSQDAVVTTIYALTNLLFVGNDGLQLQARSRRNTSLRGTVENGTNGTADANPHRLIRNNTLTRRQSIISERDSVSFNELEYKKVCENAVTAISEVVAACGDESVSTLAVTILSQKAIKLTSTVAPLLLHGLVSCAPYLPTREFLVLVKLLHRLSVEAFQNKNTEILKVLHTARSNLSKTLKQSNPLYMVYLWEMLSAIISKGDVQVLDHHRSHNEISAIGDQISLFLKPLADLLPDVHKGESPLRVFDSTTINLFRNIWFNMVVHGYSINSGHAKTYATELERIAYNTPPLASELSWDRTESSLDLNTVLKRGSSNHNVKDHKHIVGDIFEVPRTLSYSKLMFLAAALFVESLRVKTGNCHTILKYYSDPSTRISGIEKYLGSICFQINKDFVNLVNCGADKQFSAENIAEELTSMLTLCCYGLEDLQDTALQCCDLLINKVPSSLCHHKSLFALFDLLTLLYDSVVDAEISEYQPTFIYTAKKTGIQLKLPDSYKWRTATFNRFHEKARNWAKLVVLKSPFDIKSLIQLYVTELDKFQSNKTIQFGVSFALEVAGSISSNDRELTHLPQFARAGSVNLLPSLVSQLTWRSNFVTDLMERVSLHAPEGNERALIDLRQQIFSLKELIADGTQHIPNQDITDLMSEIAGFSLVQDANLAEIVRHLVEIPFAVFDSTIMRTATGIWGAVTKERPNIYVLVLSEITKHWEMSIRMKQGIFSRTEDLNDPEFSRMEYAPSDYAYTMKRANAVSKTFQPHSEIIKLLSSSFEATLNQSDHLLKLFTRFVKVGLMNLVNASLHPYARYVRFELIKFAFDVLNYHLRLGSRSSQRLTELIFDSSLSWFKSRSSYPFGSNVLKMKAEFTLLMEVAKLVANTSTFKNSKLELKKILLMFFMDDEISKIGVWLNITQPTDSRGKYISNHISGEHITKAYDLDPQLAVNLAHRYKLKNLDELLQELISTNPLPAIPYADAVQYFIGINAGTSMPSHYLLFWEALSPIDAITLFLPPFGNNPYILQYTMRSLEHHDVNLTFFYVPQIVQSLRYDVKGYVKRFILETAQISQLFAHQIIWNMLANSYKDEESTEPDSLKPVLDDIQHEMLKKFSPEDLAFYKQEFGFFNEVTSISGKLKPYIKKSKAEKKIKIDEEMALIVVQPGVYLPSNPDGVLVDINRKSGKPLQSHAKAPFMATFKIKKDVEDVDEYGKVIHVPIEKWQSAIFKVGDDCRQDVLALQLVSVFRTIWLNAGLDLYVFPYRVTATAPGCGVIDVLPNSTSRDMLGREAVNGLYEYYITKFGPESSVEFQQARNNLIRSLAAYSIISYLLQFKDRHNGNIMYDDQGHVLHIDFGFCFDIVPGGVKFEVAPFKLTKEMVMVLGGSDSTQAYQWFEELCIKGYLACRPYMEMIVRCVQPMLESGLPCFNEKSIKKLRKRFVAGKSDKDAALYFRGLIKKSYESFYTTGYDEFQRLTNGIPY